MSNTRQTFPAAIRTSSPQARRGLLGVLIAGSLALGGCASPLVAPPRPTTSAANFPAPETRGEAADVAVDRPSTQSGPRSGATTALLAESRNERDSGDLAGAAATIERALSIAPDDALLWIELGEVRLAQGNRGAAEEMARKALTLTGNDSVLEDRALRLLDR